MSTRVVILPPAEPLAPYVRGIAVRRRCPRTGSATASLVFPANLYGSLTLVHRGCLIDGSSGQALAELELAGPRMQPSWRHYEGAPEVTTVLFHPGVLSRLLRVPAVDLTERRIDARLLLPPTDCRRLEELSGAASGVARQVHALETWLVQLLQRQRVRPMPVPDPAALLRAAPERSVCGMAAVIDCGPRQMQRRSLELWGLAPKALLRVVRLEEFVRRMHRQAHEPGFRLNQLTRQSGFYDAAHLANEFRLLCGQVPRAVLANMRSEQPHHWAYEPLG